MARVKWTKALQFFGAVCILYSALLLFHRYNPTRLVFANYTSSRQAACLERTYQPVSIRLSSLERTLPIIPATIQNNKWDLTDRGVSYLTSSVLPGEQGNSILYGHNWTNLLGSLNKMRPGQNIEINYSNGMKRIFSIDTMVEVDPSQTNILNQTTDKRITLYTCSGFLDSKRLVVVGKLVEEIALK